MKHDFFSPVMPLVPGLLSCDATCIISGTILFIVWRKVRQGVEWLLCLCDTVVTSGSITWHWWHCEGHHFVLWGQDDWSRVQHDILVMWYQCWHHITLMSSSVAPFYFSVQDDQSEIQHDFFQSFDTLGTSISINWCQWHCQ